MAAKPLTTEAIAITEKKMDMALDDIIKMSKNTGTKARKQRRLPNKMQKFPNNATQDKPRKLQRFMDSRSSLRQGALAKKRSNFQGNQFPLAAEVARKAAVAPIRPRGFNRRAPNWNKTRFDAPTVQRKPFTNGTFIPKVAIAAPAQPQTNTTPRQRPQTLDSRFANMKEQRLRVLSRATKWKRCSTTQWRGSPAKTSMGEEAVLATTHEQTSCNGWRNLCGNCRCCAQ